MRRVMARLDYAFVSALFRKAAISNADVPVNDQDTQAYKAVFLFETFQNSVLRLARQ